MGYGSIILKNKINVNHREKGGSWLYRDLGLVLAFLIVTILAIFQIPKIHVDSSTDIFIPKHIRRIKVNDPELKFFPLKIGYIF